MSKNWKILFCIVLASTFLNYIKIVEGHHHPENPDSTTTKIENCECRYFIDDCEGCRNGNTGKKTGISIQQTRSIRIHDTIEIGNSKSLQAITLFLILPGSKRGPPFLS